MKRVLVLMVLVVALLFGARTAWDHLTKIEYQTAVIEESKYGEWLTTYAIPNKQTPIKMREVVSSDGKPMLYIVHARISDPFGNARVVNLDGN